MNDAPSLDRHSRLTLIRFASKFLVTMSFATLGKEAFSLAASFWFAVFGLTTSAVAFMLQEQWQKNRLTHWDEVLWLGFGAVLFMGIYRHW